MQRKYTNLPYTDEPVAIGNFDSNRQPINLVVLHTTDGTLAGALARFNDPASKVSAHYIVDRDGTIYAMLEEYYVAYANGDYPVNQRAISIEHVDNGDYNGIRPEALYEASARLVRDICTFYGIPIDRDHIKKHSEVSDAATGCPDALRVDYIVQLAANQPQPAPQPSTQPNYEQLYNDKRIECDINWNCFTDVVGKLGVVVDPNDKKGTAQKADDAIQGYQDKIANLERQVSAIGTTNTQLKTNVSEVQQRNATLLGQMQDMEKADSTAINEGIVAEAKVKQDQLDFKDIADAAETTDVSRNGIIGKILDMKATIQEQQKTQQHTANQSWLFIQQFFKALSGKKK